MNITRKQTQNLVTVSFSFVSLIFGYLLCFILIQHTIAQPASTLAKGILSLGSSILIGLSSLTLSKYYND